jgi:hypothetical protein
VPENVSICYRGANYALGQAPQFYGIWNAATPRAQPLEWWPLTPEGWAGAWNRFAAIEVPGTIAAVPGPAVTRPAAPKPTATPTVAPPGALASMAEATAGAQATADAQPTAEPQPTADAQPTAAPQASWTQPLPAAHLAADVSSVGGHPKTSLPGGPGAFGSAGPRPVMAAALLALGVVLGIVGLFPSYLAGTSLAQEPDNLVLHVIYLAAWSVSAILMITGGARIRVGALVAVGVSAVTLGLFFADLGTVMGGEGSLGAGLVLGSIGWLACTVGALLGLRAGPSSRLGRPVGQHLLPVVTLILAAVGTAVAFAPSWDSFTLRTLTGATQSLTEGNAFANPAPVIAGDVIAMIAIVAVIVVAALWRPIRMGAALVVGAVIPMAAQAISALVQIRQAISPLQFGISPAQARQLGLTINAGLTPIFWVFCAFVATLILLCAWMIIAPDPAGVTLPSGGPASWSPGDGPGAGHPQVQQMTADSPAPGQSQPGVSFAGSPG